MPSCHGSINIEHGGSSPERAAYSILFCTRNHQKSPEHAGGLTMRYTHVCLVLTLIGCLSSGGIRALAQDTTLALLHPLSEDTATTTPPSEAPTPRFLRVTIGLAAGGPTIQMRSDPVWVAL